MTTSQPSSFLRLPLELRCMIYEHMLDYYNEKRVTNFLTWAVYFDILPECWVDRPFPLLLVNLQTQGEMSALMQRNKLTIRITGQGIGLDSAGLSANIAQEIYRNYSNASQIKVEIWPPTRGRPVEMLYIWRHLRALRDTLGRCTRIQDLTLDFKDNGIFKRTYRGFPKRILPVRPPMIAQTSILQMVRHGTDLRAMLMLFQSSTNVKQLSVQLPSSMNPIVRDSIFPWDVLEGRRGTIVPNGLVGGSTYLENLDLGELETELKRLTASNAREQLVVMTDGGRQKLKEWEYDVFVRRWPYFETLTGGDEVKFEGKWHYAKRDC